jgi:hypothetical protein
MSAIDVVVFFRVIFSDVRAGTVAIAPHFEAVNGQLEASGTLELTDLAWNVP